MKKISILLTILLCNQFIIAQEGFTPKVEKYIDNYISTFNESNPEIKKINKWYANFKKADKPSKKDYEHKLIGLGLEISKEKEIASSYIPASYTLDKGKIAVKNITSKKYEQELIDSYASAYFKNNTLLKKENLYEELVNDNFIFNAGKFKENERELYVKPSFVLLFIRVYENNLYIISINSNYSIWKNREIIFYKFDLSLGTKLPVTTDNSSKVKPEVTNTNYIIPNRWEDTNRLYHDQAIDELRETVNLLAQIPPYSNNSDFVTNAKGLDTKLNRDNVKNYIPQLQFFENYKVELDDKMAENIGYYAKESVKNVNHYAAHALADIYMNKKEYSLAVSSFGKALTNKYHTAGGTRYIRCLNRIYSDLAEASFAVNEPDIGVLYLLAIIAQQNTSSDYADEQLTAYAKTINTKKFKENLIMAIDSAEEKGELEYTITFKNHTGTFEIPYFSSLNNVKVYLVKSDTYNNFKH